ncbi:STY0301 family protein [Massilia eurypsychrophila]|uniref:STY0301 family protein n=1 Tax=Massilia eurypsychrophila TaxID=1485217 RepID=UPI00351D19B7
MQSLACARHRRLYERRQFIVRVLLRKLRQRRRLRPPGRRRQCRRTPTIPSRGLPRNRLRVWRSGTGRHTKKRRRRTRDLEIPSPSTESYWLGCSYSGTTALLVIKLKPTVHSCVATYTLFERGKRQHLKIVECRGR